jgi:hypothetical protein
MPEPNGGTLEENAASEPGDNMPAVSRLRIKDG